MAENGDIWRGIEVAFVKTFGPGYAFSRGLRRPELSAWDSMNNVTFFVNLEDQFPIQFSHVAVMDLTSIGAIYEYIDQALGNAV